MCLHSCTWDFWIACWVLHGWSREYWMPSTYFSCSFSQHHNLFKVCAHSLSSYCLKIRSSCTGQNFYGTWDCEGMYVHLLVWVFNIKNTILVVDKSYTFWTTISVAHTWLCKTWHYGSLVGNQLYRRSSSLNICYFCCYYTSPPWPLCSNLCMI